MAWLTTNQWRTRLAAKILDEPDTPSAPFEARVGTGRSNGTVNPDASDTDLDTPTIQGVALSVSRVGQALLIQVQVPGSGSPQAITEAGIFTSDGLAIILDSFAPVSLDTGQTLNLEYELYPEAV